MSLGSKYKLGWLYIPRYHHKIALTLGIQDSKHNFLKHPIPLNFPKNLLINPGNLSRRILKRTTPHRPKHAMRDPVLRKNTEDLAHFILEDIHILRTSCKHHALAFIINLDLDLDLKLNHEN